MSDVNTWMTTTAGCLVLAWVLHDIFRTLARPGTQGLVSRAVLRPVWRMSRHRRRASMAGPVAMLGVIAIWGLFASFGWSLIYWPFIPSGFTFASPPPQGLAQTWLESAYISLVNISTLGLGDVVPRNGWLRLVTPVEALFGLALLTVALSWVMQVYPALTRRRTLAVRLNLLRRAGALETLEVLDPPATVQLLESITTSVIDVRVDLQEYAEIYFFREDDPDASLPANLGYAVELLEEAGRSSSPAVLLAVRVLTAALDDLAECVDAKFLDVSGSRDEVFSAYAADHSHSPAGTRDQGPRE